ncbi:HEAT repeat domain-containing protein [Pelagicoccus sp. SDUM812003]|uniref:HEAT repeat domain-containing protein n=1 Tax=Pelagicoccus sp. SDUM812003 TaxID=3041267 RepID=UPI002810377E|nr:HEAT repeat domain-containing protein [Pelagicoccus sp. SDUM812003]MDQ8204709.1 HEAT repeat domain-containing protein [Pelagicoccus sp. SDUM812003]
MEALDLNTLLKGLKHEDETERIYAAEDLAHLQDDTAIDPLIKQFERDDSIAVREAINQALLTFDSPLLVERVCDWLYSGAAATRNAAVRLLQSKGERNCSFLESLYSSERDADIRKFIVDAAMMFSPQNCCRFMAMGLEDEDINVRIAAVEYAGQRQLLELEDHILRLLKAEQEPMLVSSILESLSNFDSPKAFEAIKARFSELREEEGFYLPWIARLYGAHGQEKDLDYLIALLETCPGQVDGVLSEGISRLLQRFPDLPLPDCLHPWYEALFEQSLDDCAIDNALDLLVKRSQTPQARQLLTGALNSSSSRVRTLATEAIDGSAAKSALLSELEKRLRIERDPETKEALENAIG